MRKYRRIVRQKESSLQSYQVSLTAVWLFSLLSALTFYLHIKSNEWRVLSCFTNTILFIFLGFTSVLLLAILLTIVLSGNRDQVSTLEVPNMNRKSDRLAHHIKKLFSDKQLNDVLKLSNLTRFGIEYPLVYVWVSNDSNYGYIAIENIATYDRMDRDKYEQRVSGILAGKYKHYAVVSSELTKGDSYVLFNFEDALTSFKITVDETKKSFTQNINPNSHAITLAKDLVWYADKTPHMSCIARTRAGKSVLAGRYMATMMTLQGWTVEYNSAKYDRYVKEFAGQSTPNDIVARAEYWVSVMQNRLDDINNADKEKYLDIPTMNDIGLFFDEIGNLNAALEMDKTLKKRWEVAINQLTATGGSAGIHVIAISQFATKEGFLPSLARVNCSDAVIMLGGAADSADERKYLMAGFADLPQRSYGTGQGVARIITSGKKWETPHFYETPWFT